ncbi:response regulator [bacterium]|nr:MAG: response regulator [bacterium]
MFRVLVVEDDAAIRGVLRTLLGSSGYRVEEAETVRQALVQVRANRPDLVLLDLGLPDGDGQELVRELRAFSTVPVVVLTARAAEREMIRALDGGADDYVVKPFQAGELLARLRAALRRPARAADVAAPQLVGRLTVDLVHRSVRSAEGDVHLTPLEFRVLECLLRRRGLVVTRDELIREVWGPGHVDDTRGLRTYVRGLRRKLEVDPARPRVLTTEAGVGYRLQAD